MSHRQQLIDALKDFEARAGFRPTRNFAHGDPRVPAFYRCYFTGLLELPDSYDGLRLREGTQDGCSIDTQKHDDRVPVWIETKAGTATSVTLLLITSGAPQQLGRGMVSAAADPGSNGAHE